jgi:hypothetical protein
MTSYIDCIDDEYICIEDHIPSDIDLYNIGISEIPDEYGYYDGYIFFDVSELDAAFLILSSSKYAMMKDKDQEKATKLTFAKTRPNIKNIQSYYGHNK